MRKHRSHGLLSDYLAAYRAVLTLGKTGLGTSRSNSRINYLGVRKLFYFFLLNEHLAAHRAMLALGKARLGASRSNRRVNNHSVALGDYDSIKLVILSVKVLAAYRADVMSKHTLALTACIGTLVPCAKAVRYDSHRTVNESHVIVCLETCEPCVGVDKRADRIALLGEIIPAERDKAVYILNRVAAYKAIDGEGEVGSFTEVDVGDVSKGNGNARALYLHSVFSCAVLNYFTLSVTHGVGYDDLVYTCVCGRNEAVINLAVILNANVAYLAVLGALGDLKHGAVRKSNCDSGLMRRLIVGEIATLKLDLYRVRSDDDLSHYGNSVIEGFTAVKKERDLRVSADIKFVLVSGYNDLAVVVNTYKEVCELIAVIIAYNVRVKIVVIKVAESEYIVAVYRGMEAKLKLNSVRMNYNHTCADCGIVIGIGNDCDDEICACRAVRLVILKSNRRVSGKLLNHLDDLVKSRYGSLRLYKRCLKSINIINEGLCAYSVSVICLKDAVSCKSVINPCGKINVNVSVYSGKILKACDIHAKAYGNYGGIGSYGGEICRACRNEVVNVIIGAVILVSAALNLYPRLRRLDYECAYALTCVGNLAVSISDNDYRGDGIRACVGRRSIACVRHAVSLNTRVDQTESVIIKSRKVYESSVLILDHKAVCHLVLHGAVVLEVAIVVLAILIAEVGIKVLGNYYEGTSKDVGVIHLFACINYERELKVCADIKTLGAIMNNDIAVNIKAYEELDDLCGCSRKAAVLDLYCVRTGVERAALKAGISDNIVSIVLIPCYLGLDRIRRNCKHAYVVYSVVVCVRAYRAKEVYANISRHFAADNDINVASVAKLLEVVEKLKYSVKSLGVRRVFGVLAKLLNRIAKLAELYRLAKRKSDINAALCKKLVDEIKLISKRVGKNDLRVYSRAARIGNVESCYVKSNDELDKIKLYTACYEGILVGVAVLYDKVVDNKACRTLLNNDSSGRLGWLVILVALKLKLYLGAVGYGKTDNVGSKYYISGIYALDLYAVYVNAVKKKRHKLFLSVATVGNRNVGIEPKLSLGTLIGNVDRVSVGRYLAKLACIDNDLDGLLGLCAKLVSRKVLIVKLKLLIGVKYVLKLALDCVKAYRACHKAHTVLVDKAYDNALHLIVCGRSRLGEFFSYIKPKLANGNVNADLTAHAGLGKLVKYSLLVYAKIKRPNVNGDGYGGRLVSKVLDAVRHINKRRRAIAYVKVRKYVLSNVLNAHIGVIDDVILTEYLSSYVAKRYADAYCKGVGKVCVSSRFTYLYLNGNVTRLAKRGSYAINDGKDVAFTAGNIYTNVFCNPCVVNNGAVINGKGIVVNYVGGNLLIASSVKRRAGVSTLICRCGGGVAELHLKEALRDLLRRPYCGHRAYVRVISAFYKRARGVRDVPYDLVGIGVDAER